MPCKTPSTMFFLSAHVVLDNVNTGQDGALSFQPENLCLSHCCIFNPWLRSDSCLLTAAHREMIQVVSSQPPKSWMVAWRLNFSAQNLPLLTGKNKKIAAHSKEDTKQP